jgi:hypothetical protein
MRIWVCVCVLSARGDRQQARRQGECTQGGCRQGRGAHTHQAAWLVVGAVVGVGGKHAACAGAAAEG